MNKIDNCLLILLLLSSLSCFIISFLTIIISNEPIRSANYALIVSSIIIVITYIFLYGRKK